ncbi:hypothetical protein [Phycicoccus sp. 3266]|uniref:hypothetical protein n=1 Tax=Phycicoccus sp. 3266 TaxID=2817751 RepID=UPI002860AB92|nr:hypothetical protein [Phycicoccus sp. 3266]MDR6861955.1 hypothetical protein [Phycicoccus sp. 3266]
MSRSRNRRRRNERRGGTVAAILRDEGRRWNIACSYGAHTFTRSRTVNDARFMRCTECGAEYACTEAQWATLAPRAAVLDLSRAGIAVGPADANPVTGDGFTELAGAHVERPATYGLCTHCGSVEVRLVNPTGTRDLSSIGEAADYPTGYGCEVCL